MTKFQNAHEKVRAEQSARRARGAAATSPADTLRDAVRAVATFRATDPLYDDPRGVELENAWCAALLSFFSAGGTREAADRIEDEAFSPFATAPHAADCVAPPSIGQQYVTITRVERISRVVEITLYIDPVELDLNDPDFSPWEHYVVEESDEILEIHEQQPWEIFEVEQS